MAYVKPIVHIPHREAVIDGVEQEGDLVGDVNITVHGDIETLSNSHGTVKANNVRHLKTMSGDVHCGDVTGNVQTMSGDVTTKSIGGNVKTMSGDISRGL